MFSQVSVILFRGGEVTSGPWSREAQVHGLGEGQVQGCGQFHFHGLEGWGQVHGPEGQVHDARWNREGGRGRYWGRLSCLILRTV